MQPAINHSFIKLLFVETLSERNRTIYVYVIVSIASMFYMKTYHKTEINFKNVELRIFSSSQVN